MEKIKREIKFEADFSLINQKLKKATDSIKELKNIEIEVKLMDVENKEAYDIIEERINQRVIEELEGIPQLKTPLGEEIRLSYHYVLKRIKKLKK